MFRVVPPPLSGAQTTVSTASGICCTVTATCRYRGRVGTGLSVLWVAYATHSALKLDGHLLKVTIPNAVLKQFDVWRMSKILLETCTYTGL